MVDVNGPAREQLKAFVARIERLEEDKAAIAEDLKQVYAEAKGLGYDTKTLRKIISIRKQDVEERKEQETLLEVYMQALGMLPAFEADDADAGVATAAQ